ncbi:hypothetical protein FOZ60_008041 [Perkinsus olseni]|uniref:P-type ATPase A domain-containing protein n=2 Tax=Perkinsus olseni TaxID=32597 RepID=A0A7J6PE39_PEROL|nr:hypothetical protein FOZ60_008041 [Perkinsus olseni]
MDFPALFLLCWGIVLIILTLITISFSVYRRELVRRRAAKSRTAKDGSSETRKLPFVCADGSVGRCLVQTGYSVSQAGEVTRIGWLAVMVTAFVVMVLLAPVSYFPALYAAMGTDWNGIMGPYLFTFVVFHATAAFFISFYDAIRAWFMVPQSLATAGYVLIEEEVPALDETVMGDPGETSDEPLPSISRRILANWRQVIQRFRAASQKSIVPVEVSDGGDRVIEYTCVRYLYEEEEDRFRPAAESTEITPEESRRLLACGGLSQLEAAGRREVLGPNEIVVEVPSIPRCLVTEFSSLFYVVQSMGSWTYLGYSGWNIGLIWFLMMLVTGCVKALFIVRRGQKKVAELARHSTDVAVLRDSEWSVIPSCEVTLGDIIKVEDCEISCDGHILIGAAVVNESMLTGEPMPVQKIATDTTDAEALCIHVEESGPCRQYPGTLCMESTGVHEKAVMVVTAVGGSTTKGQLIRMVMFPQSVRFKYHDQLPIVYGIMFAYAMLISFLYLGLTNMGNWIVTLLQIFLVLLQSLNPMLPVAMVMGQTVAAKRLRNHHKIFCLQPERIPVAGKISVMVFDKTGTITKDGMELSAVLPVRDGSFTNRIDFTDPLASNHLPINILYGLAACHTVRRLRDDRLRGADGSLSVGGDTTTVTSPDGKTVLDVLRLLPFDHVRMTSGCVVRERGSGRVLALVKGSHERMGECCGVREEFRKISRRSPIVWRGRAFGRVLEMSRAEIESPLTLLGLLLFKNEVKPDSALAINMLREGDVRSVVCTGDNPLTAIGISKEVGIIDTTRPVLLGDLDQQQRLVWSDPDQSSLQDIIPIKGVHQLVVTRKAWRYLYHEEPDKLEKYWYDILVYARMKPSDKVTVVKWYQSRKLVVGMCGDGGNDCGALRAAHAAMALSQAEASMVSPFSSCRDGCSLITVVDLIREGRACLATNLATYSYYIVYALILTVGRLFITILGNFNVGEWIFLMTDILLGVFMVWTATLSGPSHRLAGYRPTASLLGWRTVLACVVPACVAFLALIVSYAVLWSPLASHWYYRVDTLDMKVPPKDWMKKGDNYDTAVLVFVMFTVLVNHVFTASYGGEFRFAVLRNWSVTIFYACFMVFTFALLWVDPCDFSCVYRVSCDSGSSLATGTIPFVSGFSVGNIGGCFLGPQVHRYQQLGYPDWTPTPEDHCRPPEEALEILPYDSPRDIGSRL